MINRRLWVQYTGSWPNQCYNFDGKSTPFWTLSDGRQVADAGNDGAYRWLLENEEAIVPFVPKSDDDWKEVAELAAQADAREEIRRQREAVEFIERKLGDVTSKAEAFMKQADELELESQKLRAIVSDKEDEFQALEKALDAERKKLEELTAPPATLAASAAPADSPPAPKKKPPAKKKPKKE